MVEYGGAGARTGQLVADIFDAYFAMQNGTLTVDEPETADPAGDDPKTEAVDGDAAADETDTAGGDGSRAGTRGGSGGIRRCHADLVEKPEKPAEMPKKQL